MISASEQVSADIVQALINAGANVKIGSALTVAIRRGHMRMAQMLVDAGANVNVEAGRYGPALKAAICGGQKNPRIAQILLDSDPVHRADTRADGKYNAC